MRKLSIVFLVIISNVILSQNKSEVFPNDLTIQPFAANMLEPKLGALFQVSNNELRLDIGNSIDVYRVETENGFTYSFGADLFTYTLLRSEDNFHFPVDAVDYLFGVNFGIKHKSSGSCCMGITECGLRFRISHISAHMVDGHVDQSGEQLWLDGIEPRVYSREFIEFMPYVKFDDLRIYAGFTYLFHVDPADIGKDNYQLGFDYFYTGLGENISLFAGYDIKLIHIDKYTANNSINAGVKFGKPNGKGFSVYYHYYSGKSVHGEYFEHNRKYSAIGINLDL